MIVSLSIGYVWQPHFLPTWLVFLGQQQEQTVVIGCQKGYRASLIRVYFLGHGMHHP